MIRGGIIVAVALLQMVGEGLAAQSSIATALNRLYREYRGLDGRRDIGTLVMLDQEIRRLIPYWTWEGRPAESTGLRPEHEELGVRPLIFAPEFLSYSGKLLVEAHRLDPASHREYTLYSTVFSGDEAANTLPGPAAADAYLREFPAGPFALHAHLALAHFYADLFKIVRGEEEGRPRDYKYECFQKYLDARPLVEQRTRAQDRAVRHYFAVTRLLPNVDSLARELAEVRQGRSSGWHYCAD